MHLPVPPRMITVTTTATIQLSAVAAYEERPPVATAYTLHRSVCKSYGARDLRRPPRIPYTDLSTKATERETSGGHRACLTQICQPYTDLSARPRAATAYTLHRSVCKGDGARDLRWPPRMPCTDLFANCYSCVSKRRSRPMEEIDRAAAYLRTLSRRRRRWRIITLSEALVS